MLECFTKIAMKEDLPRMRMRRKKNLEPRLEKCSALLIPCRTEDLDFRHAGNVKEYIDYKDLFGNDNPVYLEIGCGKGQFIIEMARRHPENNYIAVEKAANVLVTACENTIKADLKNLLYMQTGAEYLPKFLPPHTIHGIFLNFSTPFPKNSQVTHRLTHHRFLAIYRELMTPDAFLFQKTDNPKLFEFSIEELSQNGFLLKNVSLDLHNSDYEDNIVTEYEARFAAEGMPIYRLEAYLK